jgi:ABC-type antimicrobial peptide transport system permease subunit
MVVRAKLPTETLASSVAAALKTADPNLSTGSVQTLDQIVDQAVSPRRFLTTLLGGFSLLGLVLASIGIYGVISYSVTLRTNEIGIRIALGARNSSVLKLVVGQGARLAVLGVAIGMIVAWTTTRVMASLLFGVEPTDPITFIGTAVLLLGVALLACYLPARRATRIDPMIALRYD